jgi:hypothetical protein
MRQENAADHARTREFLNPAQQKAIEEVLTSQAFREGLSLRDFADRKSEVPGVF